MNSEPSNVVKFYNGEQIPLELHKVRVVQKLHLVPVERRLEAAREAGFNTFQLSTNDVYLDMLTDSGVNAMSDNQIAAMFRADDAYAGSQSFDRLKQAVWDVFGKKYLLPAHQGRACENIIAPLQESFTDLPQIIAPIDAAHKPLGNSSARECLSMLRRICKYAAHLRLIRPMELEILSEFHSSGTVRDLHPIPF